MTASDGIQAIELLEKRRFDLILMDLQMPQMDGYTATRYIREKLKLATPVIAMTASAMEGEKQKCIDCGMDGYISKPVSETELLALIGQFIPGAVLEHKKKSAPMSVPDFRYIDLTYIKEVGNGNLAYEKTITQQFIHLVPGALESLKAASASRNFNAVRQIAHNIQTTLAIMGVVPKYGYLLDALEGADASHPEEDTIGELVVICNQAMAEAREFYALLNNS
jgi:CheY-like chemotaxis protein